MDENYTFVIVEEGKVDFFKKKLLGWSGPVGQVSTWAGNLRPVGHIFPFLTWLMAQETTDLVIRLGLVGKFIIYIHSSTLLLPFVSRS